jgi:hypothetical protein
MSVLMGTGTSSHANVYRAGQEAALQMLANLGGLPQLTLVFSSTRFADPQLLAAIRSVTEGAPLIGCTNAGGIGSSGLFQHSVVVIGLKGSGAGFVTGIAYDLSKDPAEAGRRLARDLKAAEPGLVRSALVFPDGLSSNGSALLRGVQDGLGARVPVIGGSAGDDFHFQKTFQYFDDQVLTDSVPGALIYGEASIGVGVRHGWIPLGRPRQITKARGEIVYELDGRPAVAMYERYLGIKRSRLARKPLTQMTMTYPLGISREGHGDYVLRSAVKIGDKGSLICNSELPEGSWARLMIGGYEAAIAAAEDAAREAAAAIGQSRFKGALVFSSAGRMKMLGSESQGEIDVIRNGLGGLGVRLGGFYGYGEFAPSPAGSMFHNESVAVMALG